MLITGGTYAAEVLKYAWNKNTTGGWRSPLGKEGEGKGHKL